MPASRRPSTQLVLFGAAPADPAGVARTVGGGGSGGGSEPPSMNESLETFLADEAQRRYLAYALSVVTSRALPDVRDGLKPVQRRILYAMWRDLRLVPDGRFSKSAKVVGSVIGNYHPHGDTAAYDAMVRMAQPWVMRAPLVDGQGNFGSPDGDSPAAYRYTEAKLLPMALELLGELDRQTVAWRANFDATSEEPVVLPARLPHLLINGSQGIAVGMATSIPPHNVGEVIDACIAEIDAPTPLTARQLLRWIKGPDFPTGGTLLATRDELTQIYETGQGTLKLRGDYKLEEKKGGVDIVLTSHPYAVERATIVEKIAEIIIAKKLAALLDVRDESTSEVRIVLETKKGTDPALVMAYLWKNTPLQTTVAVNMTCLVPRTSDDGVPDEGAPCQPDRLGLAQMIRQFLDFRMLTITRRVAFDLGQLTDRLHILEGFAKAYDALDEIIKIIRRSEGRADAQTKLMERFAFSEAQADAILEMRLYKLARLEILVVQEELAQKRAEAKRLDTLLKSESKRWQLVKSELAELRQKYADKRRTRVVGDTGEQEFSAEDFIVDEDANVILSAQGWLKRVRELKDVSTTRVREGDAVLAVAAGSTKACVALLSNHGACYVTRIFDVPATTGYGEPVQKYFKLGDGERIVAMLSFDPRALAVPPAPEAGDPLPPYAVAVTRGGLALRFSLSPHRETSTKAGRRYAKLNDGDEVVFVAPAADKDGVLVATSDGHALGVYAGEIPLLGGVGKGSMLIKVNDGERVLGAVLAGAKRDQIVVETDKGKTMELSFQLIEGSRADRGSAIVKRDRFARVVPPPVTVPTLEGS